jgi:hypothetical protein
MKLPVPLSRNTRALSLAWLLTPAICQFKPTAPIAGVEDDQVALATFRAACQRWPGTPITLRQGAR